MLLIASKMILCLILALLLGVVIGFLLCKLCPKSRCEEEMTKPTSVDKTTITPDNLKKIKGIGEKLEADLNELGVYTFSQIASWNRSTVAWVDTHLAFKGRIDREEWIKQAKTLAKGGETEFSKKFKEQ